MGFCFQIVFWDPSFSASTHPLFIADCDSSPPFQTCSKNQPLIIRLLISSPSKPFPIHNHPSLSSTTSHRKQLRLFNTKLYSSNLATFIKSGAFSPFVTTSDIKPLIISPIFVQVYVFIFIVLVVAHHGNRTMADYIAADTFLCPTEASLLPDTCIISRSLSVPDIATLVWRTC